MSEEEVQHIVGLLNQTSIENQEISLQIKAKLENKRQMYDLKLRTLWSPLKKDGYIGIVGYVDIVKQEKCKRAAGMDAHKLVKHDFRGNNNEKEKME